MSISKYQQGFSLVLSMVFFIALTVVGLAVMRSGLLSERQASNLQEKSVTFHGAQTSNNAIIESYRYDRSVLAKAVSAGDTGWWGCVDEEGDVSACSDGVNSVDKEDGVLLAKTNSVYKNCLRASRCIGNSAGLFSDNTIGCNVFQHNGIGWIDANGNDVNDDDETQSEIEQWSLLIAACQ